MSLREYGEVSMRDVKVGVIGSGFIAGVHLEALQSVPGAKIVAIASLEDERRKQLAKKYKIPKQYRQWQEIVKDKNVEVVVVGIPNYLHASATIEAAKNGKHVICEKPLALTLDDADEMIDACKKAGVILGYAEELCFVPKFVYAKEVADSGAIGDIFFVKQCEEHGGPYSEWFFKAETAGGGILMDMGCHSIEYCRYAMNKKRVKSVYAEMATYMHKKITKLEDHVLVTLEFADGTTAFVESSWARKGGMISFAEFYGTEGVIHANLLQEGMGLNVFSEKGIPPNVAETKGWTHPDWQWNWQNGYPQEDAHFIECARTGSVPVESGADGRVILEIMLAAYWSAAVGRKVKLPFVLPSDLKYPVDLWLNPGKWAKKIKA